MKKILIFSVLIITLIMFIQSTNSKPETIKIGFVAGLSGKYSTLGTNIKNGMLLAFDEINYKIGNSKIELIQKDDKQNEEEAKKIIKQFLKDDVKVIIGNTTSSMTKVSIEQIKNEKNIVLFSPTASSNEFTAKDDNFIRTQVANSSAKFKDIVTYFLNRNVNNVIGIYDPNNLAYSKDLLRTLEEAFILQNGKKFVKEIDVTDSFISIKNSIQSYKSDLIVIAASSIDSAKLIQYLKLNNINTPILASGWSKSRDFIEEGGKAVEGVMFTNLYDDDSKDKDFINFKKAFENKYGSQPSTFSIQAYETTKIVIQTLKKDNNPNNFKQNILDKKVFEGLQGQIEFDQYGDVNRKYHLVSVQSGKFKKIQE